MYLNIIFHFPVCYREKQMPTTSSTIMELSSPTHSNVFEGGVLALYRLTCNENLNSPNKAKVAHDYIVDKDS